MNGTSGGLLIIRRDLAIFLAFLLLFILCVIIGNYQKHRTIQNTAISLVNHTVSCKTPTARPENSSNKLKCLDYSSSTAEEKIFDENHTQKGYLCASNTGRLGNRLFVFASLYGIAMLNKKKYVIPKNDPLLKVFSLKNDSVLLISEHLNMCINATKIKERTCCTFDSNITNISSNHSYRLITYLQSWKYFYGMESVLRRQLQFKMRIRFWVNNTLHNIVQRFNYASRGDVTLVGIHVRRGDMVRFASYGYQVATVEYMKKAIKHFNVSRDVIYIVCSIEIQWVKDNLPPNITNIYYADKSNPTKEAEKDLALLAACDHVITTVGTFSWWGGWLSGGNVTYYKWPTREGSELRKQFSKDYMDFFYPHWVGL